MQKGVKRSTGWRLGEDQTPGAVLFAAREGCAFERGLSSAVRGGRKMIKALVGLLLSAGVVLVALSSSGPAQAQACNGDTQLSKGLAESECAASFQIAQREEPGAKGKKKKEKTMFPQDRRDSRAHRRCQRRCSVDHDICTNPTSPFRNKRTPPRSQCGAAYSKCSNAC